MKPGLTTALVFSNAAAEQPRDTGRAYSLFKMRGTYRYSKLGERCLVSACHLLLALDSDISFPIPESETVG